MKCQLIQIFIILLFTSSCGASEGKLQNQKVFNEMQNNNNNQQSIIDTLTIGGGCFWCVEAQLLQLEGVMSVKSGYAGGHIDNPTYKEVCSGITGHAEVIQVAFDTKKISIDEVLAAFWQAHDPTQLNRQGNDIGTQYRSVIFYRNEQQHKIAQEYKEKLNAEHVYDKPVVTEISPLTVFYPAEDYHQNYYNQNATQGYCQYVIAPKLEKFRKVFKEKLKK